MTAIRTGRFALIVLVAACAKQEPPPGTPPDEAPPRPVELRPDYGALVPGFDGAARIRFDEPLTNPRNLGRDIVGSPAGRYEVTPGRRGLEVRPEDGWQPDVVYYIRLPAGVSDLLRNTTTEPVEWLFSTGGEIPDTEVTGLAIDRVTARGTPGMRVLFLAPDSVPYTAVSDTGGVFRLPGLPFGTYEVAAFQDQDRDFAYDPLMEPGGTDTLTLDASSPTAELELLVLPADTTAPVLADAVPRDSLTLRLNFDDPLDPEADLADVSLTVRDTATGAELEVAEFAVGELPPEEPPPAPADTLAAPADTMAPPRDPVLVPAVEPEAEALDLEPASTFVSVRLAEPFEPGTYEVEIDGVANLRGLEGGGAASFQYVRPEPEPEVEPGAADEAGDEDAAAGEDEAEKPADPDGRVLPTLEPERP